MISGKGHDMICKLVSAAGKANDKEVLVKSWTQLEDYVSNLEKALNKFLTQSAPLREEWADMDDAANFANYVLEDK